MTGDGLRFAIRGGELAAVAALDAMAGPDTVDGRGWRLALPREERRDRAASAA